MVTYLISQETAR